ncbi:MAG TPA: MBL fold metallo-hydrolase [Cyanobacteria bacterium UBA8543]|nr:MBL fold metallo-hydrolase [Cyanobacteria bacterium UBA8543]
MPDLKPAAPNPHPSNFRADMITGSEGDFVVQFWGVRGKISTPGKQAIRYGGNTSCVEMRVGSKCLVFDGGSGLRVLGNNLLAQMPVAVHIFFTNCHWDSIQGFPFFTPGFIPGNCFHIYGAAASDGASMEQRLNRQMCDPNFPVPLQVMKSELKFYNLTSGDKVSLDDVTVETIMLNFSHHSMGYRVTWQGRSVVYAIDRSYYSDRIDQNLLHLARQADLLILDAPNTISTEDALKSSPILWKDELWQTGIATAKAAGVKRIVMSRYNPDYDDDFLDKMEQQVQSVFPNDLLAREGMIVPVF